MNELINIIAYLTVDRELLETAVPGLSLFRRNAPTTPEHALYEPSVCVMVQGKKRVILDNNVFEYDANRYLISSVHLPTVVQVISANRAKPCLGLVLKLNLRDISQMMVDSNLPPPRVQPATPGMATGNMTPPLFNAFQRLVGLLDDPQDIPILAPVIQREIFYRLLVGDQGARLRQLASAGSQTRQIARAIEWLKENFARSLSVNDLADKAGMSATTFHQHFKTMTALSPLQFQKHLRLQEARRLMLADRMDAASAGFQVGYESPSQFSREYSRLFGAPPLRDIARLRRGTAA